ncbi:hypothetical protein SYNPS1DRAFT_29492 [Syncephalis pseudoplumigaleata]|uniref:Uncharacterized protein n=1 Tax=Syncephalis pseudoplumigaleata TaxID=1712513 RepID=A0A4P9Z099_9FUNG|nr:hypothetical protein SYNPS1DRAFT_29492 [Syncephalis pseudoplumigaleata]|eukprot:RKP24760.1 hypothetical protein SYNPS1DRAFT_29492 [Syncephalis pseudoplumigaleata]
MAVDEGDDHFRWMKRYLKAEDNYNANNYRNALKIYNALEQRYPKNTHLGLRIANCQINLGDTASAYNSFMAVRMMDAKVVESMDRFAGLVRGQGNMLLLNRMAEDLMNINEFRPEPWVAMAIYCQCRNHFERGLMLTDRALALDRYHAEAHYVKDRFHDSLKAFRVAYQYSRDPFVYQGKLAEEALERMPNNAVVLSLVANVFLHTKDELDRVGAGDAWKQTDNRLIYAWPRQSKELIERAFRIDPASMSALRALQRILVKEEKYAEAVDELKKRLPLHNNDTMHCNLGELYLLLGDYRNALEHYSYALSLDPHSIEAQEGKARAEELLPRQDHLPMGVLNDQDDDGDEHEEDEEAMLESSMAHGMLRMDRGRHEDGRRGTGDERFMMSPFDYDDSLFDDQPFL